MDELEYFNNDSMAASVWRGKYALPDEKNPDDMHRRLAKEFARIEKDYISKEKDHDGLSEYGKSRKNLTEDRIFELFKDFKWIVPQGSVMAGLGNKKPLSLSNCFVIGQPEADSYGAILHKDEELVQLSKRRAGIGIDISSLRPRGGTTNNAAKTSTGAASFMDRYSNTTREIAQGGRRSALMMTMDVRHPDIFEFVNVKQDRTKVTGANVSVMLRDEFMEAVKNDEDYVLRFPCSMSVNGNCENLKTGKLYERTWADTGQKYYLKKIRAKELYDEIVHNAWDNAEPGQMFIDRHWNYSPDGVYEQYRGETTNP